MDGEIIYNLLYERSINVYMNVNWSFNFEQLIILVL